MIDGLYTGRSASNLLVNRHKYDIIFNLMEHIYEKAYICTTFLAYKINKIRCKVKTL
jgi:hypothetical protein